MRIANINMIPYGSTGKIMLQLSDTAKSRGHETRTYSTVPYDKRNKTVDLDRKDHYVWGSMAENKRHYYLGSLLGRNGCYSRKGTRRMIRDLKAFAPDVVHLHNLHKFCVNLPLLFGYLKKSGVKVVWTLHDCWTFTGQCPHFDMVGCTKWKTGCHHCSQLSTYPKSRMDNTRTMYRLKKKWFTGVENMTLVTPSQWLADLTRESFLKDYPVQVIPNGIDLSVFHPVESDFRKKYNCEDQKILLGVAFGWGPRKGLDVFLELAKRLESSYRIVLVGTDDSVDRQLPDGIISIHRTQNQQELAEIYSTADLLVNPTREDTFPTVNMEALACGTPVLTFRTGGSPDAIDETCGTVVEKNDVDAMEQEIIRICTQEPYSAENCIARAKEFDKSDRFGQYVSLYEELVGK